MRNFVRILVVAAVVLSFWIARPWAVERWNDQLLAWRARRSIEDTVRSTAYPIEPQRWLEFDLPPHAMALRLLTNAAVSHTELPPGSMEQPRRGWRYAIEYELLDEESATRERRQYHFRARISHRQDIGTEVDERLTWFQDSDQVPTQTRTVQIPLSDTKSRTRHIRIRLASQDPQLEGVVIRVYYEHERSDFEQPYAWSRLPVVDRQRLCRASVYPPELLSPQEQRNLLRWNWTALPPRGKPSLEFQHRMIYQRENPQVADVEFLPPPDGVTCRPGIPVTIPTPAQPGVTLLEFFPDHARPLGAKS